MTRTFQEETLQICGATLSPSPPSRLPSTPRRPTASPVPPHVRPLAVVATPTLALKPPLEVGARLLEAAPSTCLQFRRGKDSSVPVASMALSRKGPGLDLGITTAGATTAKQATGGAEASTRVRVRVTVGLAVAARRTSEGALHAVSRVAPTAASTKTAAVLPPRPKRDRRRRSAEQAPSCSLTTHRGRPSKRKSRAPHRLTFAHGDARRHPPNRLFRLPQLAVGRDRGQACSSAAGVPGEERNRRSVSLSSLSSSLVQVAARAVICCGACVCQRAVGLCREQRREGGERGGDGEIRCTASGRHPRKGTGLIA